MCGIIGYRGPRPAVQVLLDGLSRLEYRGYDSAGIGLLLPNGALTMRKAAGKLSGLIEAMNGSAPEAYLGIGHTRWATHGLPNETNSHPHVDCQGSVAVVHNGIIENYMDLKERLIEDGHTFASQTDSEVVPHLVEHYMGQGLSFPEAVRSAARGLRGAHALVLMSTRQPDTIVALRLGNAGGIVVGHGEGETWLASDLTALLPYTRRVDYLAPGEVAVVTPQGVSYSDLDGRAVVKSAPHDVPYDVVAVAKGPYKHFMLKEMHEQSEVVLAALRGRVSMDPVHLGLHEVPFSDQQLRSFDRVVLIGMGTSYHAAQIGRDYMERLAGLPAEADNSSEFRYRDAYLNERTLLIAIGQSGETADTLAAMEEARRRGARIITLCNVEGSQATRIADGVVYLRAGLEIGVCATKTFTASLISLYLLAAHIGLARRAIPQEGLERVISDLSALPFQLSSLLEDHVPYQEAARRLARHANFLYLGRGVHYPIAMEGALKMKEITYIHAEGLPAGEMKHGPIALIDDSMPVVAVAPRDALFEKTMSNLSEVKARGAFVVAVGTDQGSDLREKTDVLFVVPQTSSLLQPVLEMVPLQLLAYYVALERGCDVDQPRNLAKSVTVE
jgi:glucosamine--fructose-6-phosphate aminotransferase (isomerizing)